MTYAELIRMPAWKVRRELVALVPDTVVAGLDTGQQKRLLGTCTIEGGWEDHNTYPADLPNAAGGLWEYDSCEEFAPWHWLDYTLPGVTNPFYDRVGYVTGSKHALSQLVHVYTMDRKDVPLLSGWEQIACCDNCKGSSGSCPGFAPRFDRIRQAASKFSIIAVTHDLAWALTYGSRATWKYSLTYMDRLSMNYIRRIVKTVREQMNPCYTLGVGSCPVKCKPCAVIQGEKCLSPGQNYSLEATGVNCDVIHYMLYGEFLPWAIRKIAKVPTYMTRYAGLLWDKPVNDAAFANKLGKAVKNAVERDKSYTKEIQDIPEYPIELVTVPSGVHARTQQWMYDLNAKRID